MEDPSSCEKKLIQIQNKENIVIRSLLKKVSASDGEILTCAIVQTKIPSDLKQVHSLVFYIFSIVSFFLITGLAFFIARLGSQELMNQKMLA